MIDLYLGLLWYLVFVVSTSLHEASHALVGKLGGDNTAYLGGQVSIDPLPHILREPVGMVVLPLISLFLYGWPIGYASAPYDTRWAARYPRRSALMALAGPMANLSVVICCGLCMRLGIVSGIFDFPEALKFTHIVQGTGGQVANTCALIVSMFFTMNLVLALFNLLPLPPLDGSGIIPLFVNKRWAARYQAFIDQPYMFMLGMFVAWTIFPKVFTVAYATSIALLYPEMNYF